MGELVSGLVIAPLTQEGHRLGLVTRAQLDVVLVVEGDRVELVDVRAAHHTHLSDEEGGPGGNERGAERGGVEGVEQGVKRRHVKQVANPKP